MNDIYIVIIGAISTILAAVISPYISENLKNKRRNSLFPQPPNARKGSLEGSWNGYYDQKTGHNELLHKHSSALTFKYNNKEYTGTMKGNLSNNSSKYDKVFNTNIFNVIFDGRIIKFDYVNRDSTVIQLGTVYGILSSNGQNIQGYFLGYGQDTEDFVRGSVFFKKIGSVQ